MLKSIKNLFRAMFNSDNSYDIRRSIVHKNERPKSNKPGPRGQGIK